MRDLNFRGSTPTARFSTAPNPKPSILVKERTGVNLNEQHAQDSLQKTEKEIARAGSLFTANGSLNEASRFRRTITSSRPLRAEGERFFKVSSRTGNSEAAPPTTIAPYTASLLDRRRCFESATSVNDAAQTGNRRESLVEGLKKRLDFALRTNLSEESTFLLRALRSLDVPLSEPLLSGGDPPLLRAVWHGNEAAVRALVDADVVLSQEGVSRVVKAATLYGRGAVRDSGVLEPLIVASLRDARNVDQSLRQALVDWAIGRDEEVTKHLLVAGLALTPKELKRLTSKNDALGLWTKEYEENKFSLQSLCRTVVRRTNKDVFKRNCATLPVAIKRYLLLC